MQKLLLALALTFAFSTVCAADPAKLAQKHVRSAQDHRWKSQRARNDDEDSRKTDEEIMAEDPYWDRCLSYYRGWGPGACGR